MRFWIIALRAAGLALFLLGVVAGLLRLIYYWNSLTDWNTVFQFVEPLAQDFAFAVLCFAIASALTALHRVDERLSRLTNRRRVVPRVDSDLAPVAPNEANTAKYTDARGHVSQIEREYYTRRTESSRKHPIK